MNTQSAFPRDLHNTTEGLGKRELLAAMAMQGILSSPGQARHQQTATESVKYADALLMALDGPQTDTSQTQAVQVERAVACVASAMLEWDGNLARATADRRARAVLARLASLTPPLLLATPEELRE